MQTTGPEKRKNNHTEVTKYYDKYEPAPKDPTNYETKTPVYTDGTTIIAAVAILFILGSVLHFMAILSVF